MTISDSIPVQFWPIDEETFNETDVCGLVKQDCFCQPFQCSDSIIVQFQDDNAYHWGLHVFDSDNILNGEIDFEEITDGYWQTSLTFDNSPCDQKLYLKINKSEVFSDGDFNAGTGTYPTDFSSPAPDDAWYQVTGEGGGGSWTHSSYSGNLAAYNFLNTGVSSSPKTLITLAHKFLQLQYGFRTFSYNFRQGPWSNTFGSWTGGSIEAVYYLNGTSIGTQTIVPSLSQNTTYSGSFNTNVSGWDTIGIRVKWTSSGSPFLGVNEIYVLLFDITSALASEYVAQSDCIDVKETHDCTKLITYSNTSDFDGISYTTPSPNTEFQLRIPAIFFEEENPQEQEDLELSNGVIVTLRQTIVEKRLLEVGYMPNYMHRKLQKVLMHDTVYIDGDYWKRRDSYDTKPVKKYNLKMASVLLTKYDSVEKNTM